MTELVKFIRDPKTKKPRRGAFSRIAERLNVTPATVMRWYTGEFKPGFETAEKIREMISAKIDISSRNAGRSGRKKTETEKPKCKNSPATSSQSRKSESKSRGKSCQTEKPHVAKL